MVFQTPYERIKSPAEAGGGGTKTVQSFVPAAMQIMQMIEAGRRLEAYRRDLFDTGDGEEPVLESVPLRGPDVDLVDYQDQISELEEKLAAAKRAAAAKAEAEKVAAAAPPVVAAPAN